MFRVLVFEDKEDTLELIVDVLVMFGCSFFLATNLEEAISAVDDIIAGRDTADLVLVDGNLDPDKLSTTMRGQKPKEGPPQTLVLVEKLRNAGFTGHMIAISGSKTSNRELTGENLCNESVIKTDIAMFLLNYLQKQNLPTIKLQF